MSVISAIAARAGKHAAGRVFGACLVVWLVFGFTVDGFWSNAAFGSILGRSVTDGLLVIGLTLCLLAGQIDLSIGSSLALSGVMFATLQPEVGLPLAAIIGVLTGMTVGVANAILVDVVRVNSFIATLGTLLAARAVALVVADGGPVAGTDFDAALAITELIVGPISRRVVVLVLVLAPVWVLVSFTSWGRELVAIGGNRAAARAAGVRVERRVAGAFVLSGMSAGIAGVQQSIGLLSASPVVGDTNLLTAAAAAFLGGVALTGGRGSIIAAVLAVIALASIATGLELALVQSAYQQIVVGFLILTMGVLAARSPGVGRRTGALHRFVRADRTPVTGT